MKVLLLGATGLLGHNVALALLDKGYEVVALVRPSSRFCPPPEAADSIERVEGSLLDEDSLVSAAQGCDAIVNCAGTTDMSLLGYEDYLPVNRDLCRHILSLMERSSIRRLVHVSTANTIGYGAPDAPADESSPMQAPFSSSFYARSKREGEELLLQAARDHADWHVVIVNPGFMVGPYDVKPSSGQLLLAAYRKPLMVAPLGGKSFIAVSDAAVATVNAIMDGVSGSRYLLTGENASIRDFYALQKAEMGYRQCLLVLPGFLVSMAGFLGDMLRALHIRTQLSSVNVRQLMVREYYSNDRARRDLQLPQTPLATAVRQFFEWRSSAQNR